MVRVVTDDRKCLDCGSDISNRRTNSMYCDAKCSHRYRNKEHYKNNPEYYKMKRDRENADCVSRIYTRIKHRAKKLGLDFDLDKSDIEIPNVCPILGILIDAKPKGTAGITKTSASVDRIDNNLGYVKGNIQVISTKANVMKNDATPEELIKFANWIGNTYG